MKVAKVSHGFCDFLFYMDLLVFECSECDLIWLAYQWRPYFLKDNLPFMIYD